MQTSPVPTIEPVRVRGSQIPAFLMGRPRDVIIAHMASRPAASATERTDLTLAA